jgi:hypothetical protein
MRHLLGFALAAALIPALSAAQTPQNVSADDLVKLSAAGLNDDILIALIESDRAVFRLTADDVLSLRDRGLSQRVILAMLQTAKASPRAASTAAAPIEPAPLDIDRAVVALPPAEQIEPPPPVVVNVTQQVEQHVDAPQERPYSSPAFVTYPVAVPVFVAPRRPHAPDRKPDPVYWGFGGQRRPDTWKKK